MLLEFQCSYICWCVFITTSIYQHGHVCAIVGIEEPWHIIRILHVVFAIRVVFYYALAPWRSYEHLNLSQRSIAVKSVKLSMLHSWCFRCRMSKLIVVEMYSLIVGSEVGIVERAVGEHVVFKSLPVYQ